MVRGGRGYRLVPSRGSAMYLPIDVSARTFNSVYDYPEDQYAYEDGGSIMSNAFYAKPPVRRRPFGFGRPLQQRGGYILYQPSFVGRLRRRQTILLDRRRNNPAQGGRFGRNFNAYGPPKQSFGQRRRQSRRGRRDQRNGRIAGRRLSRNALDAQLDDYMGDSATKTRLDSQLDVYFGRQSAHAATEGSDALQDKSEPMTDPNDVSMDVPSSQA